MARSLRHTYRFARGLRRLVRNPLSPAEARAAVTRERAQRIQRFQQSLDTLVWPHPSSPVRRLLVNAGLEAGDVSALVAAHDVEGALEVLRDAGVYVSYEEYLGKQAAQRGSATFHFSPRDFFNPAVKADFIATTGGSRSSGTPVELSFGYERRQAVLRAVQYQACGVSGAPGAIWLPVFPSSAGFGAVIKAMAAGHRPERWFSQIANATPGVTRHKQQFNQLLPVLNAVARTDVPLPEHVPTSNPDPVVDWLVDALRREGRAMISGYASSITAAARRATERGIDLTGVVTFPASEPVTTAKLDTMRQAGMTPYPMYAFVPEGAIGLGCPHLGDEVYHLWDHELAVVSRRRTRDDGAEVGAYCWTSLSLDAPRVLVNVENDDYGDVTYDEAPCGCLLGQVGVRTRLSHIRGLSKVVAAGITVAGSTFDELTEAILPQALGGGPGDYQFVESEQGGSTVVSLRVAPRVGPVDETAALQLVITTLATDDNGVLATEVWRPTGTLRIERRDPVQTRAGKTLSYERIAPRASAAVPAEETR